MKEIRKQWGVDAVLTWNNLLFTELQNLAACWILYFLDNPVKGFGLFRGIILTDSSEINYYHNSESVQNLDFTATSRVDDM